MHAAIVEQIRRRRRVMKTALGRTPRARRRQRLPRQLEPKTVAASYYSALLQLLERARAMLRQRLLPVLPAAAAQSPARADAQRFDVTPRELNRIFDEVSEAFYARLRDEDLEDLTEEFGRRTSEFQKRQLTNQLKAAIGVELPIGDPDMRQRIQGFTAENVALIKSIPQRFFDQVEQRVISGVREGARWETMAAELEDRFGVAKSSAQLVARDQVGKFYGELQQVRQTQLGVTHYVWRTSKDNRVREEHVERNGQRFAWDDPPEDGHPGEPVNCRCFAEPDLSGILSQL